MGNLIGDRRKSVREAREELQRIIELCRSVEVKGLDPYLVEVKDLIKVIKEYFPIWKDAEDLCLDAEALNSIASVVKMQGEWVKRRASALYRDPFLIEEKIRSLPVGSMAEIFLEVWHPIVEFEQLTIKEFREALKYWSNLLPLDERWKRVGYVKVETETTTREEMIKEGLLLGEPFEAELEKMWVDLKERASGVGRVKYWDFIGSDSYEETVRRAYLASFLITYGYARLEIHYLKDEIFILPNEKPTPIDKGELISFPIPISFEEWRKWKERGGA
jgi:septum formation topological specificity factor MinE